MDSVTTRLTVRDYDRLPPGDPAQLIRGGLVRDPAPVPWHQVLVLRVRDALAAAAPGRMVLVAPVDVRVDRHNVLQPDVLLLPETARVREVDRDTPVPPLVVEVLSPETSRRDRLVKAALLLRAGVLEVWLVDPATRAVGLRTAGGLTEGAAAVSTVLPGFRFDPDRLFAE